MTPYRCVNSYRLLQEVRCPFFRIWVAQEDVLDCSDREDGCSQLFRNLGNFTFRRSVMSQNTWIFSTILLRILRIAPDWTGLFSQSLLPLESHYRALQTDTTVPRAGLEPTGQGRTAARTLACTRVEIPTVAHSMKWMLHRFKTVKCVLGDLGYVVAFVRLLTDAAVRMSWAGRSCTTRSAVLPRVGDGCPLACDKGCCFMEQVRIKTWSLFPCCCIILMM